MVYHSRLTMPRSVLFSLFTLLVVPVASLLLIFTVSLTSACIVHNCPVGGKRSELEFETQTLRQCISCGPMNKGNCVSENICCGRDIGCYIGTAESSKCLRERIIASPCRARGQTCGVNENGRCTALGICCNEDACVVDETCDN